jgi:hypothetical protein
MLRGILQGSGPVGYYYKVLTGCFVLDPRSRILVPGVAGTGSPGSPGRGIVIWATRQGQSNPCRSHLSETFCQGPATLINGFYPRITFNLYLYYIFLRDKINY